MSHWAQAQLWWDVNGTTAAAANASGTTFNVTGTWNSTNNNWNADSSGGNGSGGPAPWVSGDAASFSAGATTTVGTITVVGTQNFSALNTEEGTYTFLTGTGGQLEYHDEITPWHIATAATINVPIVDDANSMDSTSIISFDSATGALTLGGSNSFTQGFIVNPGGLTITNSNALGDNVGTTVVANGRVLTFSGTINSPETLEVDSATLTNSTGNATSSGTINLGSNGTGTSNFINVASGSTFTMTGLLQGGGGPGPLFKVGVGTAALSGTSSYSGTLTIAGGTFAVNGAGSFGSNTQQINVAGTSTLSAGLSVNDTGKITANNNQGILVGLANNLTTFTSSVVNVPILNTFTLDKSGTLSTDNIDDSTQVVLGGSAVFNLVGNASATSSEAMMGSLIVRGGVDAIYLGQNYVNATGGAGGLLSVTASSFSRGPGSIVTFRWACGAFERRSGRPMPCRSFSVARQRFSVVAARPDHPPSPLCPAFLRIAWSLPASSTEM